MSSQDGTNDERESLIYHRRHMESPSPEQAAATPVKKPKYTIYHIFVFSITFFSYAFFHANRKMFSNIKVSLQDTWTPQTNLKNTSQVHVYPDEIWNSHTLFPDPTEGQIKTFLGTMDTSFMLAYAGGLYISGVLGDRFDLRYVLSGGMWSSSIVIIITLCVTEWTDFYNEGFYLVFWILNGFLQASGWPTVVAIMGNWFGKANRGLLFGIWSANASVGNVIGTLLNEGVLGYSYAYAVLTPALILFCGGIIVFFGLVPTPLEVGMSLPDEVETESVAEATHAIVNEAEEPEESKEHEKHHAISFWRAFLLPGVIPYSLAYACLKLVNYSFFFWLPYYLNNKFHLPEQKADSISIWYDVGGIVGGIIGGIISDRTSRSCTVFVMVMCSIPSLFIYKGVGSGNFEQGLLMVITGFFIGGVSNIIAGAISADLGRNPKISGDTDALATVTGIVDGTGSLGAALGQLLVPLCENALGWEAVFAMFMIAAAISLICLFPLVFSEIIAPNRHYQRMKAHCCGGNTALENPDSD